MSITFHNTIMHILDLSLDTPVLSGIPMVLTDETESFIIKHIAKLFEDNGVCRATFDENSEFSKLLMELGTHFYDISCTLAYKFFNTMVNYSAIPSGDLIVVHFSKDSEAYLGLLKFNYKEEYTHLIESLPDGSVNQLIKHKSIFPSSKQKIDEATLIHLESSAILLSDHSKERYLSSLLECSPSLSTKEKIKVVEHVVGEAIAENFENKIEALSHVKNSIAESIIDTSTIPIDTILEETFSEHKEVYESCKHKFEQFGLTEPTIELSNPATIEKKYSMHKLKTNTGIELKFPTQMLQNADTIEFISHEDGTISILIKNIAQLINK